MPDTVELNIEKVLKGLALESEEAEICDFTLEEQCAALESQGIQPKVRSDFKPVVDETVVYVVAAVIINDNDEILMVQEAKKACAGKWYLPAGRMKKGESIVEAAKREVLEESGLEIDCTTLLMVETASSSWVRYVLAGVITGGSLKTPAQADKESIQAKWVKNINELTLRATDITHLIDRARVYKVARKTDDRSWHRDQLPCSRSHSKILLRLVVVIKKRATNRVHVLISEKTSWHLPTCEVSPTKNLHSTLRAFMIDLFGADVPLHRPYGILSVESDFQSGQEGVCLTLMVVFRSPLEEVPIIGKCVWHETSKDLGDKLLSKVAAKNRTIPLHVIHFFYYILDTFQYCI